MLLGLICENKLFAHINRDLALQIAISKVDTTGSDVYITENLLPSHSILLEFEDTIISPPYDSWLIITDKQPLANFGHDLTYLFVNIQTGEIEDLVVQFLPSLTLNKIHSHYTYYQEENFNEKFIKNNNSNILVNRSTTIWDYSDNNYALIINGGWNLESNHQRYWNNCSFIYNTLVNNYKYKKTNIKVLCSDGLDPAEDMHLRLGGYCSSPLDMDGDGYNDITSAATFSNVISAFCEYDTLLHRNDNLFIFVADHGNLIGDHSNICLWNTNLLVDSTFYSRIGYLANSIGVNVNIVMGQCNSGGFVDYISQRYSSRITISSACRKDESSYSRVLNDYDEYLYYWISAMNGYNPYDSEVDADDNNDGFITMKEAYNYATNNDTYVGLGWEHPQYYNSPSIEYRKTTLYGTVPIITGPSLICDSAVYYVDYLPDGSYVTWTSSSNLSVVSSSGDNATIVRNNVEGSGTIFATINRAGASYQLSYSVSLTEITPTLTVSPDPNSLQWQRGSTRTFDVGNCEHASDSDIVWTVKNSSLTTVASGTGKHFTYTPNFLGMLRLRVTNNASCGTPNNILYTKNVVMRPKVDLIPSNSNGNIESLIHDESESLNNSSNDSSYYYGEYTINILDNKGFTITSKSYYNEPHINIPLNKLNQGIYYIQYIIDEEIIDTKTIKINNKTL